MMAQPRSAQKRCRVRITSWKYTVGSRCLLVRRQFVLCKGARTLAKPHLACNAELARPEASDRELPRLPAARRLARAGGAGASRGVRRRGLLGAPGVGL